MENQRRIQVAEERENRRMMLPRPRLPSSVKPPAIESDDEEHIGYFHTAVPRRLLDDADAETMRSHPWIYGPSVAIMFSRPFLSDPEATASLLKHIQQPSRTPFQGFLKSFYLQCLLVYICANTTPAVELDQFLTVLRQENVSLHGWRHWHAVAMVMCFLQAVAKSILPWLGGDGTAGYDPNERLLAEDRLFFGEWEGIMQGSWFRSRFWGGASPNVCPIGRRTKRLEDRKTIARLGYLVCQTRVRGHDIRVAVGQPRHMDGYVQLVRDISQDLWPFSCFCLLPAVLSRMAHDDEEKHATVLQHSPIPWMTSGRELPRTMMINGTARQYLHDGPTCSGHARLLTEQCRISLRMCTSSGSMVASLQSLCRDVILRECLTSPVGAVDLFFAVGRLPLPRSLKELLLHCAPLAPTH